MHHSAIRDLINDQYAARHGATPAANYPTYLTIGAPDAPLAALGFRAAAEGALFLEAYLDRPIEAVVSERLGRLVPRSRIVELGDHASYQSAAAVKLWCEAAVALEARADVAVAVLTRPLRTMFARLNLPLVELAPARSEALGGAAAAWGRYYQSDPILCAGLVGAGRQALERAAAGSRQ